MEAQQSLGTSTKSWEDFSDQMIYSGSVPRLPLGILPSSLATSSFKKNGAKGEWRGSQMLSLSRQPFLSTHYWDFGEGAHPRDLLLPSLN